MYDVNNEHMFWELLESVIKCMIVFQILNFYRVTEILKITMSLLYFNEDSDYSEENTCENEVFHSTIERN